MAHDDRGKVEQPSSDATLSPQDTASKPVKLERPTLLRVLVTGQHWRKYETFATQYERAANEVAARDHDPRLRGLSITRRQFTRWLAGTLKTNRPYPDHCRVLEYLFGRPIDELLSPAPQEFEPTRPGARAASDHVVAVSAIGLPDLHQVELLRQGLNDALSEGTMAEASIDDWERTVIRYGRASRDRPAVAIQRG